jgi:Xaa-Pro aminopeptidase
MSSASTNPDLRPGRVTRMAKPTDPSAPSEWSAVPIDNDLLTRSQAIDQVALRRYRLDRLRAELRKHDYAGALLSDPINIRYATGTRNMAIWTMHSPGRYAFVATEGPVVLFDFAATRHVNAGIETVTQLRDSTPWFYFLAGPRLAEKATIWADEIAGVLRQYGAGNRRLAVDRCDPLGAMRLHSAGIELFDVQESIEQARSIKSAEEIASLQLAMDVCDLAVARVRASLAPGLTENQLWSILHETNIAHGGEWIECRLLACGERTNPWFQECGDRVIQAGDVVAFDTDMVGPHGYLADISRSLICPGRPPTDRQRMLYDLAQEQVLSNVGKLRPGLSFREFAETCWPVPERYFPNRYMMMVHGVGLVDEYPSIPYAQDFADWGYDGVFQENMVVSVESYMGEIGGADGIKLEQQVLISANGAVPMSRSPFTDALKP